MNTKNIAAFFWFSFLSCSVLALESSQLTDDQIRQQIIQKSIASYRGSCPCPYSVARNGSSCGGRSAYSRAGGYQPKCYPQDVSDAEVQSYKRK